MGDHQDLHVLTHSVPTRRASELTDVAVVAMPHERLGEGVCAYVIADAPVSVADIGSFLGEQGLARQKWPARVEMVDAFPRAASGKVQRSEEHTPELQSLMRISSAVFCLKTKNTTVHQPRS